MGETGVDVKLSKRAKSVFPYAVECKNTEGFANIYKAFEQANSNSEEGIEPIVFLKSNRKEELAVMRASHFFELRKRLIDNSTK